MCSARALLRGVTDDDKLDAVMQDSAAVRAILNLLEAELDLSLQPPERGSVIVGLAEGVVVKMMAPHDPSLSDAELASLRTLHGALPIPTPEVLDTGELEGWRWILMTRLKGRELVDVWPGLSQGERLSLATQVGEGLGVLHSIEAPPEVERVDWEAWRSERISSLVATQRRRGCPGALLEGLEEYVRDSDTSAGRAAWLHTEVMLEHLLISETSSGWRLSGLFDFEPSWVGPVHYEFVSVGLFVSAGDSAILAEILRASGTTVSPRRLFALMTLHRYCNLAWFHQRLGGSLQPPELTESWFGH